jgi:S1-C subfamily serine protease
MKSALSLALVAIALGLPTWAEAKDQITNSVVKIYATQREPDFQRPWTKRNPQETSGSGAIIEGKRIITNAHVVLYASQLFVQADQTTERVPAKVVAIAPGIDLALLEVDRASFFDGRPPLPLADGIAMAKQSVSVYGYPMGGEQISVTQGIVSRIEYVPVNYQAHALRIQIDAALNPGNSGGPAIADGKIVGLVFSKFTSGENIGYLLAADEIRMFLKDIKDGTYDGKPQLWDNLQTTENEALRARLGLTKESGVMVNQPASDAKNYPLKKWDVITRIEGEPLDAQGNVKVRDDLRLYFQYLVPKVAKKGHVKLTILRNGKTNDVEVPVQADGNCVIPYLLGKYPRYFIYGPMVFMPASQDLTARLMSYGQLVSLLAMTQSPLLSRTMDHPAFAGEELVMLGFGLLPHKTSKGYGPPPFSVVASVNGTAVRNLAHLVELLRDAKGEFLTVEMAGVSEILVFRREEAAQATEDILSDEGVRKQYSDDLESVWHRGKK